MSKQPQTPQKEPEPEKRNSSKSIALLLECDEQGLWTLTHCRTQGTPIAEAIHSHARHAPSNRDLLAIQGANINRVVWGYMEGML